VSKPKVKLAHVALTAGVSKSTASQALSGSGRVSESTRAKVLSAAKRLGYRPDIRARSLSTGRLHMVGLVIDVDLPLGDPDSPRLFWPRVQASFTQRLLSNGMSVVTLATADLNRLDGMPLDLVILLAAAGDSTVPQSLSEDYRVLVVNSLAATEHGRFLWSELTAAAERCLDHLWSAGSRKPIIVRNVGTPLALQPFFAAYQPWCDRKGIAGVSVDALEWSQTIASIEAEYESGADAILWMFGNPHRLLKELGERGIRVPDDMMLLTIGEGTIERHLQPSVTSISFLPTETGERFADATLEYISTGVLPKVPLPSELLVRQSTSPVG
jgi:DNA-binding LacI/PurR family transcriptional regulator